MALTNFAALTTEQKTAWARDLWKMARNQSFVFQFTGTSHNAMIHRVTELTKNEKGARAVLTLLADLTGDGVVGDYKLEDNEEAIKSYDQVIQIDQLRHANRIAGRMAEQRSIVNFRNASKDVLAYWIADRVDQLGFLSLSGIDFTMANNGATRPVLTTGQNLGDLDFAADVSAPTSARHLRPVAAGTGDLEAGNTATMASGMKLNYKSIVNLKAYAKDHYIRGVRTKGGDEVYHMFVTPQGMAQLKLDSDFITNVRHAGVRGDSNTLFAGSDSVMVDGVIIHQHRHVYNTTGASGGNKWGATGTDDGYRALFCGAQALGIADLHAPMWEEDYFDYGNQLGISVGKILGFKKPVFHSNVTGDDQDFGVIAVDCTLA